MSVVLLAIAGAGAAQDFETVAGAPFSLQDTIARGPVVLVFWNTWLPESAQFLPAIQEIDAAAARGALAGALVIFQDEGEAAVRVIGDGAAGLPRVLDRRGALVRRFQVTRAPTVLAVDRGGAVLGRSGPDPARVGEVLALVQRR